MLLINRFILLVLVLLLAACEESSVASETESSADLAAQESVVNVEPDSKQGSADASLTEMEKLDQSMADLEKQMGMGVFSEPWTGDLNAMIENRIIRVLTVYGLPRYYIEEGREKGLTYEWMQMFEEFVNEKLDRKHVRIHVVFLPVARDELIPALIAGRGDIIAAGFTITPERAEKIDFSQPITRALSEVLVTGPLAPKINKIEDLAGQKIFVRASSSYRSSLDALNIRFKQQGLEPIEIDDALEELEDEDLLEMVNAGMFEWAVVDDYKARIWADIFENLTVREDLAFRTGGRIGLGMRKDSPELAGFVNEFVKTHKQGTLKGNILINRYLKDFDWAENALGAKDYQRFQSVVDIFLKYGTQYGVDYLMVAAQGYQESRLDQSAKSGAGAIGIMQLLPSTAADANVGIPDITNIESNIHAGVKYLEFIRNRYFSDPEIDTFNQTMFAFAAYNAGPARVRKMRDKAKKQGYDANVWFDNVELIAAKEIGRETVQYVANILKYYVAYSLTIQQKVKREKAKASIGLD
jgi:membrane-bound lytic murein transglycosylase MltF